MILEKLGIYGWKEADENLLLASLLTGDPLLLIGNHGCAKTLIANKLAGALGRAFVVYDASKAMFEDVLGYPDIEKLKKGVVEYVPSKVTVWDKEFILIDELNRALPELQSKWLEIIRSRKIMGIDTAVKWVWSAMNPLSYSATQELDEALIGRFALFIYPPDVLSMDEADRIRVTTHINGDDAPSLGEWLKTSNGKTVCKESAVEAGNQLDSILRAAAGHFMHLKETLYTLSEFLARFATLLMKESAGEIALDGRRIGFIYRNILANRAIELAKADILHTALPLFSESARYVVHSSIPVGLNDESLKREEAVHKMEICFDLLSLYFDKSSEIACVNLIYELFTTQDLMRMAEILLTEDIGVFAQSKAWNDLINGTVRGKGGRNITLLAYTALQIEARRPGTVPQELLESLSAKQLSDDFTTSIIPSLKDDNIEYIDEVEVLLKQKSDLAKLVAFAHVKELAAKKTFTRADIEAADAAIRKDIALFEALIAGKAKSNAALDPATMEVVSQEGGRVVLHEGGRSKSHADIQAVA